MHPCLRCLKEQYKDGYQNINLYNKFRAIFFGGESLWYWRDQLVYVNITKHRGVKYVECTAFTQFPCNCNYHSISNNRKSIDEMVSYIGVTLFLIFTWSLLIPFLKILSCYIGVCIVILINTNCACIYFRFDFKWLSGYLATKVLWLLNQLIFIKISMKYCVIFVFM